MRYFDYENYILHFSIVLFVCCATKRNDSSKEVLYHKLNDIYTFKIKEVISDSRCPKDVNCVWEGQVELILSIYKNEVFFKDELLILNSKNSPNNKSILEQYTMNKIIEGILLYPEKRTNEKVDLKDYYLDVFFED